MFSYYVFLFVLQGWMYILTVHLYVLYLQIIILQKVPNIEATLGEEGCQ
jgi:hypothetical protein